MQQIAFVIVRGLKTNIQILTFRASLFLSLHHYKLIRLIEFN